MRRPKARVKAPAPVKKRRRSWRDVPDEIILALARKETNRAESLCPSPATTWGFVLGDPRCTLIIDEWKFRFPVRLEADYAENSVSFVG